MPFHPAALRPSAHFSRGRGRLPSWLARKSFSCRLGIFARFSSSLPSSVMAMRPVEPRIGEFASAPISSPVPLFWAITRICPLCQLTGLDERREFFILLELHQAGNRLAARCRCSSGNSYTSASKPGLRGEIAHVTVRPNDESDRQSSSLVFAPIAPCAPCVDADR